MIPGPPLLVAIDGPSAAGKSTLVAEAARELGWVPLAEAWDRIVPRPDLSVRSPSALRKLERTLLAEEGRRWLAAATWRRRGWSVLADTGFLGPITYSAGLAALKLAPASLAHDLAVTARRMALARRWGLPDAVVYLNGTTRGRRLRAVHDALRHPPELVARHERVGRWERRWFTEQLPRALPGRLVVLRGERTVSEEVRALRRIVDRVRPLPNPLGAARRALALFMTGTPAGRIGRRTSRQRL